MIDRYLNISNIIKEKNSAFLFGPRGVGKTLLCKDFVSKMPAYKEVNLLKNDLFSRYITNPGLFRKEIEAIITSDKILTVFIDEVQKLPIILDEVHYLLEQYKNNVRFILTGSSSRKLKRGGANLLAGRAWSLKLHPLTHLEVDINLEKALSIGTLPANYLEEDNDEIGVFRTLKGYVETYLREEIMQEALVRKVDGFIRFLDFAGQMNSEPVNFSKIARNSGISTKTAQEYFSILVDTLIAFRINAWSFSIKKQIQKAPKFYFFDCGILNAINGELNINFKKGSFKYGKLFETFIVQEIIRINDYLEADFKMYYWRTNTGLEVDLILAKNPFADPIAIEIKSSDAPSKIDLKGLLSFKSENKNALLYCLCNTENPYKIDDITVFPWRDGIAKIFNLD